MKPHEFMKQKRLEKGYTQEEMANQLYIAKSTYNQYETGKRRIDIETYQRIITILGVEFLLEERRELSFDFVLHNPNPLEYDIIAYSTYHCYEQDAFEVFFKPIRFYLVPKTFMLWAEGECFENSSGLFQEEIDPDKEKLEPLGITLKREYDNGRYELAHELTDYFTSKKSKLSDYLSEVPIRLEGEISSEAYKKAKRNKIFNLDNPSSSLFDETTWRSLESGEFVFKALDYCTHWDN